MKFIFFSQIPTQHFDEARKFDKAIIVQNTCIYLFLLYFIANIFLDIFKSFLRHCSSGLSQQRLFFNFLLQTVHEAYRNN